MASEASLREKNEIPIRSCRTLGEGMEAVAGQLPTSLSAIDEQLQATGLQHNL